jgi:hypothetical protein
MLLEHCGNQRAVSDIAVDKRVQRIGTRGVQRIQVAGVSQPVEIENSASPVRDKLPDKATSDEATTAGNQNALHENTLSVDREVAALF